MGTVSENKSGWKLCKIANGSLSCENPKLNENDIPAVMETVQSKYGERTKQDIYEFLIEQE